MDQKIILAQKKFFLRNKKLAKKLPSAFIFSNQKTANLNLLIDSLPLAFAKEAAIIIREYDLVSKKRQEFVSKIAKNIRQRNLVFLVGKDMELSIKTKANGFHFSDFDQMPITTLRKIKGRKIISLACHNLKSLKKANRNPLKHYIDLVFISPIFNTIKHTDVKGLGLVNLRKLSLYNKKPLYALGGINEQNINSLVKIKKLSGFAGISLAK